MSNAMSRYNRVVSNYASSTNQSTVRNANGAVAISGSNRDASTQGGSSTPLSSGSGGGGGTSFTGSVDSTINEMNATNARAGITDKVNPEYAKWAVNGYVGSAPTYYAKDVPSVTPAPVAAPVAPVQVPVIIKPAAQPVITTAKLTITPAAGSTKIATALVTGTSSRAEYNRSVQAQAKAQNKTTTLNSTTGMLSISANKVAVMNTANAGKSASQIMTAQKPATSVLKTSMTSSSTASKVSPAVTSTKSVSPAGTTQSLISASLHGNNSLEYAGSNYTTIGQNIDKAIASGGSATTIAALNNAKAKVTAIQNSKDPIAINMAKSDLTKQLNIANNDINANKSNIALGSSIIGAAKTIINGITVNPNPITKTQQATLITNKDAAVSKQTGNIAKLATNVVSNVSKMVTTVPKGNNAPSTATKVSPQTTLSKTVSPTTSIAKLITPTASSSLGASKTTAATSSAARVKSPDPVIPAIKAVAKALTPTDNRPAMSSNSRNLLTNTLFGNNSVEKIPGTVLKSSGLTSNTLNSITNATATNVDKLAAENKNNANIQKAHQYSDEAKAAKTDAAKQVALNNMKTQLTIAKQAFK